MPTSAIAHVAVDAVVPAAAVASTLSKLVNDRPRAESAA
jgi:hypothetical protein